MLRAIRILQLLVQQGLLDLRDFPVPLVRQELRELAGLPVRKVLKGLQE